MMENVKNALILAAERMCLDDVFDRYAYYKIQDALADIGQWPAQALPVAYTNKAQLKFVAENPGGCVFAMWSKSDYLEEIPLYTWPPAIDEKMIALLVREFPLLEDEGLSETDHHCEWVLQQERKRLHAILKKFGAGLC